MPGIDKAAFLKRIGSAKPEGYGDDVPGMKEPMDAPEEGDGEVSCGAQLLAAVNNKDAAGIDAALKEAAIKYGR